MNKSMIKLVSPLEEHEIKALEYIKEFNDHNSKVHGSGGLDKYSKNYKKWLNKIENDYNGKMSKDRVQSATYFAIRIDDNKIIGTCNIRFKLNESLLNNGGHIGYGVRPLERKKGYATEILYLALVKCKEYGIERVLVTCDKNNIGSAKTIQNNFGILENEFVDTNTNEIIQRYWIDVNNAINNK